MLAVRLNEVKLEIRPDPTNNKVLKSKALFHHKVEPYESDRREIKLPQHEARNLSTVDRLAKRRLVAADLQRIHQPSLAARLDDLI